MQITETQSDYEMNDCSSLARDSSGEENGRILDWRKVWIHGRISQIFEDLRSETEKQRRNDRPGEEARGKNELLVLFCYSGMAAGRFSRVEDSKFVTESSSDEALETV